MKKNSSMHEYPKISVIMPVFNNVDFVEKSILSVISQNYPNLEFIVIDGGSTDGTLEVINKYRDSINYFVSEKDYGMWHACNKGMLAATGEYIGFLPSDDLYLENALLKIGEKLINEPDIDVIYGEAEVWDSKGDYINIRGAVPYNKDRLLHIHCYISFQASFFKRNIITDIGLYDTNLRWCADWDYWKRIAIKSRYKFQFIDERIGVWRYHSNSISYSGGSRYMLRQTIENWKNTRKYSTKLIAPIEIRFIPYFIVGFLGLRGIIKKTKKLVNYDKKKR